MRVHMSSLRASDDFRETLRNDGWKILTADGSKSLDATHPQLRDEKSARLRLHRLGLLTSGFLRIEFARESLAVLRKTHVELK
jgi:hypothetical protein